MDNLTHTLAGLLIARLALSRAPEAVRSPRLQGVAVTASALVANLPDADVFYTGWRAAPLKYLLYHRGYTHTILIALLLGLATWGLAALFLRGLGGCRVSRAQVGWLGGIVILSAMSHLLLDWTNSYGVHPFWPLDNHWYYGDAVFIVEPWLWIVSLPILIRTARSRISRLLLGIILLAGLGLAWKVELISRFAAAALTLGAGGMILATRLSSTRRGLTVASTGWAVVSLTFGIAAGRARTLVIQELKLTMGPPAQLLDLVISPMPANPTCFSAIAVQQRGGEYLVNTARVTLLPGGDAGTQCSGFAGSSAVFSATSPASSAAIHWDSQWRAPLAELRQLREESCLVRAGLKFIRVPVWSFRGDSITLGDARFGGGTGGSFSDLAGPRHQAHCGSYPPWIPPFKLDQATK